MIKQLMLILLTSMFLLSGITSNKIFNLPVKELVFILITLITLYEIYNKNICLYMREGLNFLGMIVFLFVWGIIGISNGFTETVIQHAIKICTAIVLVLMLYTIIKSEYIHIHQMYNLIKGMFWCGIWFKFIIEIAYMSGFMTGTEIVEFIEDFSNVQVASLSIADGYMMRVGTILDVVPLSIFPFLILNEYGRKKLIIWICVLVFVYINFSRIYIIQFIVFSLLLFVPDRLSYANIRKSIFLGGGVFLLLFLITSSSIDFYSGFEGRFVGVDAEVSDFYRYEQVLVFSQEIPKAYILGNGLGAYINGFIRSESFPFLYELEYLAILYQFGFLGLSYLVILYMSVFLSIPLRGLDARYKILIITNFLFFLIRPAFNPMLLASSSSMVLVCCFIFSKMRHENIRGG